MSSSGPLYFPRLITLAFSAIFAIVAAGIGLNALVESRKNTNSLKATVPPPTSIDINIKDVTTTGAVASAASLLIFVFSVLFAAAAVLPGTRALSLRTLRLQAFSLIAAAAIILGSMIPYMVFFTKRGPKVKAFVGGNQLPDSVVAPIVNSRVGNRAFYKNIDYLKLLAVFPWIALFFTLVAAAVLFKAGGAAHTTAPPSTPQMEEKEEDSSHVEKA
jgi:lysylphosphatidylglycerol synthetase-like protein (DUF2156 family)